jgi:hypothetical protein
MNRFIGLIRLGGLGAQNRDTGVAACPLTRWRIRFRACHSFLLTAVSSFTIFAEHGETRKRFSTEMDLKFVPLK